ncbi:hypothetical protein T492DRAFT_888075 [Pavlovales sp. CCMP2436]|nr:hypothetical protein T492DRAFT_888075 [Pavlovales sp. CCMP2436]
MKDGGGPHSSFTPRAVRVRNGASSLNNPVHVYDRPFYRKVEGPRGTLYLVPPLSADGEPRMIERGSLELQAFSRSPRFCLPERLCDAAGLSGKDTHGRQLMLCLPADAPVDKNGWFQLGPTARSHASTLAGHVGWGVAILSDQYTGETE